MKTVREFSQAMWRDISDRSGFDLDIDDSVREEMLSAWDKLFAEAQREAAAEARVDRRKKIAGKTILDLQGQLSGMVTDVFIAHREKTGEALFTEDKADLLVEAIEELCELAHAIGHAEALADRSARKELDGEDA